MLADVTGRIPCAFIAYLLSVWFEVLPLRQKATKLRDC